MRSRRELERVLHDEFEIEHTTLQVDHDQRGELVQLDTHATSHEGSGR
jgi:hypothetical protein